jgi:hypothetical protein
VISALAIACFAVGSRCLGRPREASAEIFRDLSEPLRLQHRYLPGSPSDDWRMSRVNGNLVPYRVERHAERFDEFLATFVRQFVGADSALSTRAVPVFHYQWESWGVVGVADRGPSPGGEDAADGLLRGLRPPETRPASGGTLIVVAFAEEATTSSLSFWLDDAFDVRELVPQEGADAPGRDARDVPRFPGFTRRYTVEADGANGESLLVVYAGSAGVQRVADFLRGRLPGLGWALSQPQADGPAESRDAEVLTYRRGDEDCVIGVTQANTDGLVQVVVALRNAHGEG